MAEKKAAKKAKPAPKSPRKGDVMIVIGGKESPEPEAGVQVWALEGEEVTKKGDRKSIAYLSTQDLFALGWIRRKY